MKKLILSLVLLSSLFVLVPQGISSRSYISFILVTNERPYTKEDLQRIIHKRWPDLPEVTTYESIEGGCIFSLDTYRVGIVLVEGKIPESELEYPISTTFQWKNAKEEIGKHKKHYIIFVRNYAASHKENMLIKNKVVQAFGSFLNAIAIYEPESAQVFKINEYNAFLDLLKEEMAPIPLWVKITGYKNEKGSLFMYTVGMESFNYNEIEIATYPGTFSEGYMFLLGLTNYILSKDIKIKDGETVGLTEEQKIKVRYKGSERIKGTQVMSLEF